ncbi:MAG: hypothetical protein U5K69_02640 [Balneolaceae bacterium]|nr:hypothetical protein [Balneolaceae bacterium]
MSNPEEIGFQLDNLLEEVEETSRLLTIWTRTLYPSTSDLDDMDMDFFKEEVDIDVPDITAPEEQDTESESTADTSRKRMQE